MHRVCKNWMRIERSSSRGLRLLRVKLPTTPTQRSWLHSKAKAGGTELLSLRIQGMYPSDPRGLALCFTDTILLLSMYFPGVEMLVLTFAPMERTLEALGSFPKLRHLELVDPISPGPYAHRIAVERLNLTSLTVRYMRCRLCQSLVSSTSAIHDLNIMLMADHGSWKPSALIITILCVPVLNLLVAYEGRRIAENRLQRKEYCQG